jgi:hypothetical protein
MAVAVRLALFETDPVQRTTEKLQGLSSAEMDQRVLGKKFK